MYYTIENIKKILCKEIKKQGHFFILEEFMDYFSTVFDKSIIKDKGNYLLDNNILIINDCLEIENLRHFSGNNQRKSFGITIIENQSIHCFDISINGTLLSNTSKKIHKNKSIPTSFYICNDGKKNGVLLFRKDQNINSEDFHILK